MNVKVGMTDGQDLGQWCYVSAQCGGAHPVNEHVSWKQCESGKDVLSREKSVQELLRMADDNDLLYPVLFKGAYLTWDSTDWANMKYYMKKNNGKLNHYSFPPAVRTKMDVHRKSGNPVIFAGPGGGMPFGVWEGDDLYEINENLDFTMWKMANGVDFFLKPSKMANISLYMGAPGISLQVKHDFSACSCLPWQKTYQEEKVKCGESNEVGPVQGNNTGEGDKNFNCRPFYESIKEPICMNVKVGMTDGQDLGQWCYVSAQCGGAHPVNEHVSWKQCESGKDVLSREKSVQELLRMADDNDLLYPVLFKGAYLTWDSTDWANMKYYMKKNNGKLNHYSFPPAVRTKMDVHRKSGNPVIFAGPGGGMPFGVWEGDDLYEINENLDFTMWKMANGVDFFLKPSKMANISLYAARAH